jgi:hypothetical protein
VCGSAVPLLKDGSGDLVAFDLAFLSAVINLPDRGKPVERLAP